MGGSSPDERTRPVPCHGPCLGPVAEAKIAELLGLHLEDKVVVITGASHGIGRAIALEMGSMGSRVILVARDLEALEDVSRAVRNLGGDAHSLGFELSSGRDARSVIDAAL